MKDAEHAVSTSGHFRIVLTRDQQENPEADVNSDRPPVQNMADAVVKPRLPRQGHRHPTAVIRPTRRWVSLTAAIGSTRWWVSLAADVSFLPRGLLRATAFCSLLATPRGIMVAGHCNPPPTIRRRLDVTSVRTGFGQPQQVRTLSEAPVNRRHRVATRDGGLRSRGTRNRENGNLPSPPNSVERTEPSRMERNQDAHTAKTALSFSHENSIIGQQNSCQIRKALACACKRFPTA